MKRRTAGRSAKPRVCALCGGLMSADRPVYLVHTYTGTIVGPYHAGCAEKEVLKVKAHGPSSWEPKSDVVEFGRAAREETPPW